MRLTSWTLKRLAPAGKMVTRPRGSAHQELIGAVSSADRRDGGLADAVRGRTVLVDRSLVGDRRGGRGADGARRASRYWRGASPSSRRWRRGSRPRAAASVPRPVDTDELEAAVDDVLSHHVSVDVLVNNAGHSIWRSLSRSTERIGDFERTMQLNYLAAVALILKLTPAMRKRGDGQVVNVSTFAVPLRQPGYSAYIASKAALDAVSDCFQAETLPDGVRFTTVHMPLVDTPMIAPKRDAYRGIPRMTADEAAEILCNAIVQRPRRLTPFGVRSVQLADGLSPNLVDAVRNQVFRTLGGR